MDNLHFRGSMASVTWLFECGGGRWGTFDAHVAAKLEAARTDGLAALTVDKYEMDLVGLTQKNTQTGKTRKLRRVVDAADTAAKRQKTASPSSVAPSPSALAPVPALAPAPAPAAKQPAAHVGPPLLGLTICVSGQMSMVRAQFHTHLQASGDDAGRGGRERRQIQTRRIAPGLGQAHPLP